MSKLIAITGNSGKSVFSYYFADLLAQGGKKVFIVSTDNEIPTFSLLLNPNVFATKENTLSRSLGRILSLALIDTNSIFSNAYDYNRNANVCILCYPHTENKLIYPDVVESSIKSLFSTLLAVADYVLVDTSKYGNSIDKYVLASCEHEINITTADNKGFVWRERYNSVSKTSPLCKRTNVLINDNPYNPTEDIRRTFKSPLKHIIPFCKALQPLYNGATIQEIAPPKAYQKVMQNICKEVSSNE